jgi:hypothetical protein
MQNNFSGTHNCSTQWEKRYMRLFVLAALLATVASAQEQQPLPDNLMLLTGKQLMVGRASLCVPKTFQTNLNYAGKQATVISVTPGKNYKLPASSLNRLTPEMRAQMEDIQKSAILLLQFEDGTKLDTCAAMGPKMLSDYFELAPGQTITPVSTNPAAPGSPATAVQGNVPAGSASSAASSTAAPASPATPQECPVVVTKVTSGDGGFGHALADGMTNSEFQRQLDQTTHGGRSKHYLDMRMRNNSSKPMAAIESVVIYSNKMGDETTRDTLVSQNTKPIKSGAELKSYSMDRSESAQNGTGEVTLYVSRVRFEDGTFWTDNGSHSCSLTNKSK